MREYNDVKLEEAISLLEASVSAMKYSNSLRSPSQTDWVYMIEAIEEYLKRVK